MQKGLRETALSTVDSLVIGVASTGPAYSIAATLGLVAAGVGFQAPAIVLLAFLPTFCCALGYAHLNRAEPDCGTSFVWVSRAFGPHWGWLSGWAIVVCDVLVMASLAQVTGQYAFLLFGADEIGSDPTHPAVLAVGLVFILGMTWLCVRGIRVSAKLQTALVGIEAVVLLIFAVVALARVGAGFAAGTPIPGSSLPSWEWFVPINMDFSTFANTVLLMVFIYWGWDSVLAVNEETRDRHRAPGRAALTSTVVLLGIYLLTTVAALAYAGVGTTGLGLANPEHFDDVIAALGTAVFGDSAIGQVMVHLLVLMVLTSAAASTQTTLLPTARTTFSMAFHKALPAIFGRVHPRWLTPTVSTWAMGLVSAVLYVVLNFTAGGGLIADAVTACGIAIGFYYGMTGLACAKLYRPHAHGPGQVLSRLVLPGLGGLSLLAAAAWLTITSLAPDFGETVLRIGPLEIGNVFVLGAVGMLLGIPLMLWQRRVGPDFFRRGFERSLPADDRVPEELRD